MLTTESIDQILTSIPARTIGLVGDLFLDRYLDIDAARNEPSVETGLIAYQVTRVRSYPGALGTVMNNLAALGVGRICPIAVIGDDGEGYELRQALSRMPALDQAGLVSAPDRRTPTYTKPMLEEAGRPPRELSRLDIKNRTPTPAALETAVIDHIERAWSQFDALIVLDQVSEVDCGVVTRRVRERIAELAARDPNKFVLADSREQIGKFRNVCVKPNADECKKAVSHPDTPDQDEEGLFTARCLELVRTGAVRAVFGTSGERGIYLARTTAPDGVEGRFVPAYPVSGPIDICGAGDSCSAGISCAMVAGQTYHDAAAFGNLVASITVQQIGTTGTASPAQVRQRWIDVGKFCS
ncbi:bifunctional heptose 7-phosphate kinase/heptose 1-phosphate adenyltransferase [Fimbriiglobus ruber]|uniref:ADP-heptose synthase n=1 Tax=Fimbriiglobus ruber TaxID=1908690 RepID=A0A225DT90_9BACT|nr:PfkB family carbohydrate kinase [Fimbriiglobus ruber]OWK41768.1 ADP-heptose synthase [Fimbriiglobus ruber]